MNKGDVCGEIDGVDSEWDALIGDNTHASYLVDIFRVEIWGPVIEPVGGVITHHEEEGYLLSFFHLHGREAESEEISTEGGDCCGQTSIEKPVEGKSEVSSKQCD